MSFTDFTKRLFFLSSLVIALFSSSMAFANQQVKYLLLFHSGIETVDSTLVRLLSTELESQISSYELKVLNIQSINSANLKAMLNNDNNCILTLGRDTLEKALTSRTKIPIYSILVPKSHLDALINIYKAFDTPLTGIYSEQSFQRQLLLLQAIDPQAKKFGVIFSQKTRFLLKRYQNIARQREMNLSYNILKLQESSANAIDRLDVAGGFVIILNDEQNYSEQDLRLLLVAGYQKNIALIGSKLSDTDIAALASVYTPYSSLAKEAVSGFKKTCLQRKIFPAKHAINYKVKINQQIIEQLNYKALNEKKLQQAILSLEKTNREKNHAQ